MISRALFRLIPNKSLILLFNKEKGQLRKYILFLFIVASFGILRANEVDQMKFRSLLNLSNYIGNDYVNAIQDGEVINEFEYAEMQEFVAKMTKIHGELSLQVQTPSFLGISENIDALNFAIQSKDNPVSVQAIASQIGEKLLEEGLLSNVPANYPNIVKGKQLYLQACAQCHGANGLGDGTSSVGLNPAPANFRETAHIFPFHIYNTVQLGIEGTSMVAQSYLTEQETWDIAFYVMTLSYPDSSFNAALYPAAAAKIDLVTLANNNNANLEATFNEDAVAKVKALRFHKAATTQAESLDLTLKMLQESMRLYHEGQYADANQLALDAYFIGFEPAEIELGATSPGKVTLIEKEMMIFRSYLADGGNDSLIKEQYEKIVYHFDIIQNEEKQSGFWFVFIASISILLREGLEALLIIVAILAALNTFAGGERAKKYVHAGWIFALLIGIMSYFFAGKIIALGSHKRELIEGAGALLAVVILLSVGFWLHDKSNAMSWNKYVKDKLSKHLGANSLWSVALLAFVVVFREAFESVIFLSSLSMGDTGDSGLAVLFGTIFSTGLVMLIGMLIIKFSKRLPIHQVFKISSITMIILAVILAGKGIKELQEAAFVGVNLLDFRFSVDLLGFYPTFQTILAQVVTLLIALVLWFLNKKRQAPLAPHKA